MIKKGFCLLIMSLVTAFVTGCGGERLTTVSGSVTWKGKPVVEGRMEFAPVDGKTASVAAVIENGTYTIEVPPGEKIVRIFAFQKKGERKVDDGLGNMVSQELLEQVMPPKMNVNSELRLTVEGKEMKYNQEGMP